MALLVSVVNRLPHCSHVIDWIMGESVPHDGRGSWDSQPGE